jgi:hypothetical protein
VGFESQPVIMMPYNPAYYLELFAIAGFQLVKNMYAYEMKKEHPFPERFVKFANKVHEDRTISIRNIDMKQFDREVDVVHTIYNDAWQNNWGFVPLSKAEFRHMAKDLKAAVDPAIVFIAEVEGEPAAFSLAFRSYQTSSQ